jgi:hypothetical protein
VPTSLVFAGESVAGFTALWRTCCSVGRRPTSFLYGRVEKLFPFGILSQINMDHFVVTAPGRADGNITRKRTSVLCGLKYRTEDVVREDDTASELLRRVVEYRGSLTNPVYSATNHFLIPSEITETKLPISFGWLDRWKRRRGILFRRRHGDSAGVDSGVVDQFLKTIVVDIFRRYNIEDIYNGDEWGMFWNLLPSYGPIKGNTKPIHGVKQSKDRFTAFCAFNITRNVYPPLVIGKSEHPRAFKGINDKDLPVIFSYVSARLL